MAAEAGAELSGMEFSAYYTVAPAFSTMTRSMSYALRNLHGRAGVVNWTSHRGRAATEALARALLGGGRFYCSLHRMPMDIRARLTRIQPEPDAAFRAPFGSTRSPTAFPVTLHGEGTIRGTAGCASPATIAQPPCRACSPPATWQRGRWSQARHPAAARRIRHGRFRLAGGPAKRQPYAPGCSPSRARSRRGTWRGRAASAAGAHRHGRAGRRCRRASGGVALRKEPVSLWQCIAGFPAASRRGSGRVISAFFRAWHRPGSAAQPGGGGDDGACAAGATVQRSRGTESRGMHRRIDAPARDPRQQHRLLTGGWIGPGCSLPPRPFRMPPDDRVAGRRALHCLQHLRAGLPDQRVRCRPGRQACHRAPGRIARLASCASCTALRTRSMSRLIAAARSPSMQRPLSRQGGSVSIAGTPAGANGAATRRIRTRAGAWMRCLPEPAPLARPIRGRVSSVTTPAG